MQRIFGEHHQIHPGRLRRALPTIDDAAGLRRQLRGWFTVGSCSWTMPITTPAGDLLSRRVRSCALLQRCPTHRLRITRRGRAKPIFAASKRLFFRRRAQLPVADDAKSRFRMVLTKQRDPVDRERLETSGGKSFPLQHPQDRFAPAGVRPGSASCGNGSPPSRRDSPQRSRCSRCRGVNAEGLRRARYFAASGARKPSNSRVQSAASRSISTDGSAGTTARKPLIEATTGRITGMGRGAAAKDSAGCKKPGLAVARRQRQRRLQRGVKTVFAGIARQIVPVRHTLQQAVRKGQVLAAEGVIAEQSRAEAIEVAAGRRCVVDRVAGKACHIRHNTAASRGRNCLAAHPG